MDAGVGSKRVNDLTPARAIFLAGENQRASVNCDLLNSPISTPKPLRPATSTFDSRMRFIASWPRT